MLEDASKLEEETNEMKEEINRLREEVETKKENKKGFFVANQLQKKTKEIKQDTKVKVFYRELNMLAWSIAIICMKVPSHVET